MKKILKFIYSHLPFKQYLFSLMKSTYQPPHSIYQHLYFKGIFKVKVEDSHFLLNHYGFEIENEIFWKGIESWEKISMKIWIDLSKKAVVIFDIGANTGIYSLVAKTVNPSVKVYAFEPVTRVFDKLQSNMLLNNYNAVCYEVAVSNYNGVATIYDQPTEHILSVTVNQNLNTPSQPVIATQVKTVTLASVILQDKIPTIDLIKIDVETHEPEVLEGFKPYLEQFKPTLLIEILNNEIGARVEALLHGLGYLYFNIDEQQMPRCVEHITTSDYYNYLICSRETADYLKLI